MISHFNRVMKSLVRTKPALMVAVGMLLIAMFAKLSSELVEQELDSTDSRILIALSKWRTPSLDSMAVDITALGSVPVLFLVVGCVGVVLALDRQWWLVAHLLAASIGGALFTAFFKAYWARERPHVISRIMEMPGFSYPSGHSLAAASVLVSLGLLAQRLLAARAARAATMGAAFVLIALVGASRMYLGVHYPSDVLAGVLFGVGWALLVEAGMRVGRARFERRQPDQRRSRPE